MKFRFELLLVAAGVGLLLVGTNLLAAPTGDPGDPQGVVEIGPDHSAEAEAEPAPGRRPIFQPGFRENAPAAASAYWIGLLAGPVSPELRAHLNLPEGKGLMVREVVPNSPAEKAGLEQYDVVVAADDSELADMRELIPLVSQAGEENAQINLQVIRQGQQETIWITPEERPQQAQAQMPTVDPVPLDPQNPGAGIAEEMMRRWGGMRGQFPRMNPGFGGMPMDQMPNGVSVSISKQNNQPAKITVKRGGEQWVIEGDDPESLAQLPEDLRPFVEQMAAGLNSSPQLPQVSPWNPLPDPAPVDNAVNQRVKDLEQQMEELKRKLLGDEPEDN